MIRRDVITLPAGMGALLALPAPSPASAGTVQDARLLDLLRKIRAAEAVEEAAFRADGGASSATDLAEARLDALHVEMAATPAAGALGIALKGIILAKKMDTGLSLAEMAVGDSLLEDAGRLFPDLGEALA